MTRDEVLKLYNKIEELEKNLSDAKGLISFLTEDSLRMRDKLSIVTEALQSMVSPMIPEGRESSLKDYELRNIARVALDKIQKLNSG